MIDKLIASDFAALAVEDRQVPSSDTLMALVAAPAPKPPRAPRVAWRVPIASIVMLAIAGGVVFEGALLLDGNVKTFNEARQLGVALVLAVLAMLGLFGFRRVKSGRPLPAVIGAGMFTAVAVISCIVGWHQHRTDCAFFDGTGGTIGPCQVNPVVTTTRFVFFSYAVVLVVAAVVARLIRRDGPRAWSVPANVVMVTVLVTWLGLNQYKDTWVNLVNFHYQLEGNLGDHGALEPPHIHFVFQNSISPPDEVGGEALREMIRATSEPAQWNALEAGFVLFLLAISIGIACTRERTRPSRWLALLESPAIVPLGVVVATGGLLLAMAQWPLSQLHRGDPDDIPWFAAWASVGAVVAFASMLLRRRRREALS